MRSRRDAQREFQRALFAKVADTQPVGRGGTFVFRGRMDTHTACSVPAGNASGAELWRVRVRPPPTTGTGRVCTGRHGTTTITGTHDPQTSRQPGLSQTQGEMG